MRRTRTHHVATRTARLFVASALLAACSAGSDAASGPTRATRLAPGGSQDFGLFRDLVERGEIPSPDTLDATGFFAEHAIGTPEASCGQAVCASASLGVLRNLMDGRTCTLVRVGFATPRAAAVTRPAHLVILAETAGADTIVEAALDSVFAGLRAGDTVSFIAFGARPATLATETTALGDARAALLAHEGDGGHDLYAGLRAAYTLAETTDDARDRRVLVLTRGATEGGITSPARIADLVRAYAREGVATSVFGFGDAADPSLWSRLAGTGAGNAFFAADAEDVREILREELATSFTPIARDVRVRLDAGNVWNVVGLYGVSEMELDTEAGIASIPSLFLAGRRDGGAVMGEGMGRRGGGGALLFELMPRASHLGSDLRTVGDVAVEYVDPATGETVVQRSTVSTPFDATSIPEDGFVGDGDVDKAFVVLNVFVAFKTMTLAVQEGDHAEAIAVGRALEPNLEAWLAARPDTDVEDDLAILRALLANVERDAPADTDVSQAQPTPRWSYD